jgi:hypothetical protein
LAQKAGVADVAGDGQALAPGGLDVALRFLGVLVLVLVEDHHVGALLGEADGDRAADAAVAAGDDGALARELVGRLPVLHPVLGLRRHLRLDAGLMVLLLRRLRGLLAVGHGVRSCGVSAGNGPGLAQLRPACGTEP